MKKLQVKKEHYNFEKYMGIMRWDSLYYQVLEILRLNPKSVLEIGGGNKILKNIINGFGIKHEVCDYDGDLKPDYIADIRNLNIYNKYDIVCAFQVLEHIPYDDFLIGLDNLAKCSKKYVIISLPNHGLLFHLRTRFHFMKIFRFSISIPLNMRIKFNGEHYWEIGAKDFSLNKIKKDIQKKFNIINNYIVPDNPYHRMFILQKKNNESKN